MDGVVPVHGVISNIPSFYHSSDLRNYFSQFIESKGFECFHFRHRPEKQIPKYLDSNDGEKTSDKILDNNDNNEGDCHNKDMHLSSSSTSKKPPTTMCCVFKLVDKDLKRLINMYHRKHWLDKKGNSIPMLCYITKIRVQQPYNDESQRMEKYKTRLEQKQIPENRDVVSAEDLEKLPELHPPSVMPNGNVGTPTKYFLDMINQCRLPSSIINKLGLTFPKLRSQKKYGNVHFEYRDRKLSDGHSSKNLESYSFEDTNDEDEIVTSAAGHTIRNKLLGNEGKIEVSDPRYDVGTNVRVKKQNYVTKDKDKKEKMELQIEEKFIAASKPGSDEEDHDNDSCEEWERHEAMCDDPSNQERNNERLFEEEIELKWEKGGSGLVFYTDAQYWKQQEGDFDEQTTDDWDVDMSAYYEPGAGDKDIKDFIAIRHETQYRVGTQQPPSCFSKKSNHHKKGKSTPETVDGDKVGQFEQHTKGIGRKILQKQGWKEGEGLGSSEIGIADALEGDGQGPWNKKGFGYRDQRSSVKFPKKRAQREVIISTVYDDPKFTDPPEKLLRRNEAYNISYRDSHINFKKATDTEDNS